MSYVCRTTVSDLVVRAASLRNFEAILDREIRVSQNAIGAAKRSHRVLAEMAVKVHRSTAGQVPTWLLRPDLWDPPTPSLALYPAAATVEVP